MAMPLRARFSKSAAEHRIGPAEAFAVAIAIGGMLVRYGFGLFEQGTPGDLMKTPLNRSASLRDVAEPITLIRGPNESVREVNGRGTGGLSASRV